MVKKFAQIAARNQKYGFYLWGKMSYLWIWSWENDFCPNCGLKITKIKYNNGNSDNNGAVDDETTTDNAFKKDEKSFVFI